MQGERTDSLEVHTVEVGSISLAYVDSGQGEPIIFAHGIPTDYRAWNAQVGPFSKKYRAIMYSRRLAWPNQNGGDPNQSTIENNSSDLVGLINNLGVSPAHIIGHSYGGFVAAYVAARNPELVRSLVLVEPAVGTILVRDRKNPIQLLSLLLRSPSTALSAASFQRNSLNPSLAAYARGDFDTALRLNLDGIMNRKNAFEQFPELVQGMLRDNEKTVAETGTDLPVFGRDLASRISAPTLLINGTNGLKVFRSIVDRLGRAIPNNETAQISASAHFPHLENPEEFNTRVLEFLSKHS